MSKTFRDRKMVIPRQEPRRWDMPHTDKRKREKYPTQWETEEEEDNEGSKENTEETEVMVGEEN